MITTSAGSRQHKLLARKLWVAADPTPGGAAARAWAEAEVAAMPNARIVVTAGAALLVVGDRDRGPVARHLIGSTSRRVLRDANCTVAVVRTPGRRPACTTHTA